jgi:hypothetical protein
MVSQVYYTQLCVIAVVYANARNHAGAQCSDGSVSEVIQCSQGAMYCSKRISTGVLLIVYAGNIAAATQRVAA